jgi:hypothetical protein
LAVTSIQRATNNVRDRIFALRRMLPHKLNPWYVRLAATPQSEELAVSLTVAHITPLISLLAGVLILVVPALLNYIVAIYLIVAGLVGLNEIHHFLS